MLYNVLCQLAPLHTFFFTHVIIFFLQQTLTLKYRIVLRVQKHVKEIVLNTIFSIRINLNGHNSSFFLGVFMCILSSDYILFLAVQKSIKTFCNPES